jgi:hypothetical protein
VVDNITDDPDLFEPHFMSDDQDRPESTLPSDDILSMLDEAEQSDIILQHILRDALRPKPKAKAKPKVKASAKPTPKPKATPTPKPKAKAAARQAYQHTDPDNGWVKCSNGEWAGRITEFPRNNPTDISVRCRRHTRISSCYTCNVDSVCFDLFVCCYRPQHLLDAMSFAFEVKGYMCVDAYGQSIELHLWIHYGSGCTPLKARQTI